jgi:GT2 family glycosyltransferase
MRVAVVTPTIGSEHLVQCIESVSKQTYKDIVHYVVKDGSDVKVPSYLNNLPDVKFISLDENIGKGWYGHRVYAACSFLSFVCHS